MTVIVVLGAGNIGATLARKWTAAGHQVTLASRNPRRPRAARPGRRHRRAHGHPR
jgi:predicted dinucleotide-binding enzyme